MLHNINFIFHKMAFIS